LKHWQRSETMKMWMKACGTWGAVLAAWVLAAAATWGADVTVENVTARQRYPWNGLVDIEGTVTCSDPEADVQLEVSAENEETGASVAVRTVKLEGGGFGEALTVLTGDLNNGKVRMVWDAGTDLGEVNWPSMAVVVTAGVVTRRRVQLWAGGPYWATKNIGAEWPDDYGLYFWWGDTVGYKWENNAWVASDGSATNFSFGERTPTYRKDIATLESEGWITADRVLTPAHDAAHVHWGGRWRMPTLEEMNDLCNQCDWRWVKSGGSNGYIVSGRGDYASATIFLPAGGWGFDTGGSIEGYSGRYWSCYTAAGVWASRALTFSSDDHCTDSSYRLYGQNVRAVRGFTE
jgi:hypothetical protein